jgi:hypothetical protein
VNRLPFSTLLSAVSRLKPPLPPLARHFRELGSRTESESGRPLVQQSRSNRTVPSCRANSIPVVPPLLLETARNSQVPATPGVAGVPVTDLPPAQLTSTKDHPNRTIREFARHVAGQLQKSERKRKLMALENTEPC